MLELVEYAVVQDSVRPGFTFFFAEILDEERKPTGKTVFCHTGNYRIPELVGDEVLWTRHSLHRNEGFHWAHKGEIVAFERRDTEKGTTTERWCFARQIDRAHHPINAAHLLIETEDGVQLWAGDLNFGFGAEPIITTCGKFPSRLPDGFNVVMLRDTEEDDDNDDCDTPFPHYVKWEEGWEALQYAFKTAVYKPA